MSVRTILRHEPIDVLLHVGLITGHFGIGAVTSAGGSAAARWGRRIVVIVIVALPPLLIAVDRVSEIPPVSVLARVV